jgi:hypothetical protein
MATTKCYYDKYGSEKEKEEAETMHLTSRPWCSVGYSKPKQASIEMR